MLPESSKPTISEFAEMTGKTLEQVRRLWRKHPGLKAKVPGEKTGRVDLTFWNKLIKQA